MNFKPVISKTIGIGSMGLLTYDSLKTGKDLSVSRAYSDIADNITDVYISHEAASRPSTILEKIKKSYRRMLLDETSYSQFTKAKNMVSSCLHQVKENALPIGLAAGAIFASSPMVSGVCAGLLVLGGIKVFLLDVLKVGNR